METQPAFTPPLPADPPSYECRHCSRAWPIPSLAIQCCWDDGDDE